MAVGKGNSIAYYWGNKTQSLDDSAGAFDIKLTAEDLAYLEEPYVPHEIVGAIDKNPAQGVILLDEKK